LASLHLPLPNVPEKWDDEDENEAPDEPSPPTWARPGTSESDQEATEEKPPSGREGKHTRFRKDLVNLNKGVAKWLVQERDGLLTHDDVVRRIRRSAAGQHLRASRGEGFREADFVDKALARGEAALRRRAA